MYYVIQLYTSNRCNENLILKKINIRYYDMKKWCVYVSVCIYFLLQKSMIEWSKKDSLGKIY